MILTEFLQFFEIPWRLQGSAAHPGKLGAELQRAGALAPGEREELDLGLLRDLFRGWVNCWVIFFWVNFFWVIFFG